MEKNIDHFKIGKEYYINKQYKNALNEFSQIELDMLGNYDEGLVHHYNALCHSCMGHYKRSIQEFELSLKFRPNYGKAYLDMGLAYYFFYNKNILTEIVFKIIKKKSRLHKALKSFEDGIIIEPDNADLWYYRAYMLELIGRKSDARSSFRKSKQINRKIQNYEKSKLFP